MRPRILGFLLAIVGFTGMFFAGYLFVTGSGDRGHLLEVTAYLIVGAICFFTGINYIYDSTADFTSENAEEEADFEEIPPIQQQWRTFNISTSPAPVGVTSASRSSSGSGNTLVAANNAGAPADRTTASS